MLDVVDLINKQDTRNEIGIGAMRDAFADSFFSGTSTIFVTSLPHMVFKDDR